MKARFGVSLLGGMLVLGVGSAWAAGDAANGKKLHDAHCLSCHAARFGGKAETMYTRPDRKKKSLEELRGMVQFCDNQVGTQWFDNEINDVAAYLNEAFYHFK